MKKNSFLYTICFRHSSGDGAAYHRTAHTGQRNRLEKIYGFKGKQYKPLIAGGQAFSPYQQSLRDSFITWMQRSKISGE